MKEDIRTKNLTLRDIHVGDWVQVWNETTKGYSLPLKIIQICDDGTIYLVMNDKEKCAPRKENIKNVDVLPITPELLKGFGFEIVASKPYDDIIRYTDKDLAFLSHLYEVRRDSNGVLINIDTGKYCILHHIYMHQFITYAEDLFDIKAEWKGVKNESDKSL